MLEQRPCKPSYVTPLFQINRCDRWEQTLMEKKKEQVGKMRVLEISTSESWMYNLELREEKGFEQLCVHTQAGAGPWPGARLQHRVSIAAHAAFRLPPWISDTHGQQTMDYLNWFDISLLSFPKGVNSIRYSVARSIVVVPWCRGRWWQSLHYSWKWTLHMLEKHVSWC